VRAALYENPHFPECENSRFGFVRRFAQMKHEYRLALMRNPCLAGFGVSDLVLTDFDQEDTTLRLIPEQRDELALAYLSNKAAIQASHDQSLPDIDDGVALYSWEKERTRFWELLSKYKSKDVRWQGFRRVGGKDAWKAAAYAATDDPHLRLVILRNTSDWELQTIRLGVKDADADCRELAQQKYEFSNEHRKAAKSVGRPRRILGYAWTGAVDFMILLVVLLLFSKAQGTFERLVVALFVYLHLKMTGWISMSALMTQTTAVALDEEFRRVRAATGEQLSYDDRAEIEMATRKALQALEVERVKVYTHGAFQILVWIAVLYNLASSLL
jgi:hypothetical protein